MEEILFGFTLVTILTSLAYRGLVCNLESLLGLDLDGQTTFYVASSLLERISSSTEFHIGWKNFLSGG